MFKKTVASIFLFLSINAFGFEIYALGTSNTNCMKGGQEYTKRLTQLLQERHINATVINGGVDGDKPVWMMNRLKQAVNNETRLVIFEPGPNELNKSFNLESSAEILTYLHSNRIPTVYVSNYSIQTPEEGMQFAKQYNAYFYGNWAKNVPMTTQYRTYDQLGSKYPAGHMTAEGCSLWAEQMVPLLEQIINNLGIK